MTSEEDWITVSDGRQYSLYLTDVLSDFAGGQTKKLQDTEDGEQYRAVYRIKKDSSSYIFKTIQCPVKNKESIDQTQKEFYLARKCCQLTDGAPKVIKFKEQNIKPLKKYVIQVLYEYYGEDFNSMRGRINGKEVMEIMTKIVDIMVVLEENGIFYSDIKPANIVYKDVL